MTNANIHIGTSGWQYDHWRGPFYPEDLSKNDFLSYYAERFQTVEINNSFYQLPKKETLNRWRDNQMGFSWLYRRRTVRDWLRVG